MLETRIDGYLHTQGSAALTWTIVHNRGTLAPAVDVWVLDGGDTIKMLANSVTVIDANTLELTFAVARSGKAMII